VKKKRFFVLRFIIKSSQNNWCFIVFSFGFSTYLVVSFSFSLVSRVAAVKKSIHFTSTLLVGLNFGGESSSKKNGFGKLLKVACFSNGTKLLTLRNFFLSKKTCISATRQFKI